MKYWLMIIKNPNMTKKDDTNVQRNILEPNLVSSNVLFHPTNPTKPIHFLVANCTWTQKLFDIFA